MKELMKKRQETFRTQCVKYSRYVLNDHFVLFMLIFIGFLAVQYSQFLQDLPKDTSLIRWSLMIGLLLLVPIGSIATYLEKPRCFIPFGKGRGSETLYQRAGQEVFCVLVFDSKFCPSIICASSSGNGAG